MEFRRAHSFYSPASSYDGWPDMPTESLWVTAKRLTDNRLRAMRVWIERGGNKTAKRVGDLRSNLVSALRQLAKEAQRDRYDQDRSAARIGGLIEIVKDLDVGDGPNFPFAYDFLGIEVPKTVTGSSWDYRNSSPAYHRNAVNV